MTLIPTQRGVNDPVETLQRVVVVGSQMGTTTDTYSHVRPALAQEAADKLGRTLWG
jgi:hypothetical protein